MASETSISCATAMVLVELSPVAPGDVTCNSSRGECAGLDSHMDWCNIFRVSLAGVLPSGTEVRGGVRRCKDCLTAEKAVNMLVQPQITELRSGVYISSGVSSVFKK